MSSDRLCPKQSWMRELFYVLILNINLVLIKWENETDVHWVTTRCQSVVLSPCTLLVMWSSYASPDLLASSVASVRTGASQWEPAPWPGGGFDGQNFITPRSISRRHRARLQTGTDQDELQGMLTTGHGVQRILAEQFFPDALCSTLPGYQVWKVTPPLRTHNFRGHPNNGLSPVVVKTLRCACSLNHRSLQHLKM